MKFYYVYILKCADQSYYTGMTSSLEKRLIQHKKGKTFDNYILKRRPVDLVWHLQCNSPNDAIQLEKQIKGWSRRKKEALIRNDYQKLSEFSKNYTEFGRPEARASTGSA